MPIAGLSYVALTGTFINLRTALPSVGQLRFTMPFQLVNTATNTIVVPGDFAAILDTNGSFAISLPCTDDPDFIPTDRYWQVTEAIDGHSRTYAILLPASPSTVDLADIAPVDPVDPAAVYTLFTPQTGYPTLPGNNVFTGFNQFRGLLGIGDTGRRIPASLNYTINGPNLANGSDLVNKVGLALDINTTGGFTGETAKGAPDPGFMFDLNGYWLTGTTTGDIVGLTDYWGGLLETHNRTPGATLNTQKTLIAQSYVDEATAHTNTIWSAHMFGPAGAGTAGTAITLDVDSPSIGTTKYALKVNGSAPSLINGALTLNSSKLDMLNGTVATQNLNVGDSGVTGGLGAHQNIKPNNGVGGIAILAGTAPTIDMLRVMQNSGVPRLRVDPNIYLIIGVNAAPADAALSNNEMAYWLDPTVGATKAMFKAKDSAGTVRTGSVALT